jgi:hypothetical protein
VWAQESFCHAIDKGAWMKEMFRVLRPGGRLVIEDWFRPHRPYHPADEAMFREWLRGWAIEDLATRDEIVADATQAGFVNAKLDDITPHVIRSVRRLYAMTVALFPGAYLGKLVKLRSEVLHGNIVSARLQWRARNRNLWISGIFSAQKPEAAEAKPPKAAAGRARAAAKAGKADSTSAEAAKAGAPSDSKVAKAPKVSSAATGEAQKAEKADSKAAAAAKARKAPAKPKKPASGDEPPDEAKASTEAPAPEAPQTKGNNE